MLRLLRIVAVALLGIWGTLRTAEEAFGYWVRRATRPGDLSRVVWA